MNRRDFLASMLAGLALDPEKALWIPGKRLISIPKPIIQRSIDFTWESIDQAIQIERSKETKIRHMRTWDEARGLFVNRIDIPYGFIALPSELRLVNGA